MIDYQQVVIGSALIHTGPGYLKGVVISIDGNTPGDVIFYNNTTGSGTSILTLHLTPQNVAQPFTLFFADQFAPRFTTGLFVSLSIGGGVIAVNLWARGV